MALCMRKNALAGATRRSGVARSRVVSVNAYKVTLKTPSGTQTIECPEDTYILVGWESCICGTAIWGVPWCGCSCCRPSTPHLRLV